MLTNDTTVIETKDLPPISYGSIKIPDFFLSNSSIFLDQAFSCGLIPVLTKSSVAVDALRVSYIDLDLPQAQQKAFASFPEMAKLVDPDLVAAVMVNLIIRQLKGNVGCLHNNTKNNLLLVRLNGLDTVINIRRFLSSSQWACYLVFRPDFTWCAGSRIISVELI